MKYSYQVSVRLMTFNHERYIANAIDGILIQKTTFKVEVVIGDDFSTDKTLEIIKQYKDTEDIHFKILNRPIGGEYWKKRQKYGRLYNFTNILDNCTGNFIAFLDGDDYWTDPLKLQKQVDFLEKNKDCSMVFTGCQIIKSNGDLKIIKYNNLNKIDVNEYLNNSYFMATASLIFRKNIVKHFSKDWMIKSFGADFIFKTIALIDGKIGYVNRVTCVYNKGVENSWSNRKLTKKIILKEFSDNLRILYFLDKMKGIDKGSKNKKIRIARQSTYLKMALSKEHVKGLFYLLINVKNVTYYQILYYLKNRILR